MGRTSDYIPGFDGLRAFAVAAVFMLHLDRPHFVGGAVGVDVFFVISAYLITGLLLQRSDEPQRFRRFYWRRVFRLYPALILFVFFVATPTAIAAGEAGRVPLAAFGSLFYINDFLQAFTHRIPAAFDQTWSLAVEEQFYLVWAPMLLLLVAKFRLLVQGALIGLIALVGFGLLFHRWPGHYFLPTGHLFGLALGSLAAWARFNGWNPRLPRVLPWASAAVLVAAVFWTPGGSVVWPLWMAARFAAATVLVVDLDCQRASILARPLTWRPVTWVGVRSYGIYLYGLTLMQLIPTVTGLTLKFVAPLAVIATGLVAGLSYRWVEAPIRRRGRRWIAGAIDSKSPAKGDSLTLAAK